ncbi:MAG: rubrerythrin family protein [Dehalococcoidales bacterium]|nr:rubrerythrin family protein [Dehalococcoidales bacterium]
MDNTGENLKTAFAGESQASRRYLFFAEKAEKESYKSIARLFRAAAEAETVHARNHLGAIGGIGTTEGNLGIAIEGEHYEFMQMYPGFIDQAETDKNKRAQVSFSYANEVEKVHHALYQEALQTLRAGKQIKDEPYYVCQVCGNTVAGEAPEVCPICGSPRKQFKRVE